MLPLWWPRTVCVYCGARLVRLDSHRASVPLWLACPKHDGLLALDPVYVVGWRR